MGIHWFVYATESPRIRLYTVLNNRRLTKTLVVETYYYITIVVVVVLLGLTSV